VEFAAEPLTVSTIEAAHCAVAVWSGRAPDAAAEAATAALSCLDELPQERVVHDFSLLHEVGDEVSRKIAAGLVSAQRMGRTVTLVRCPEELFRRLRAAGAPDGLLHTASLSAATGGFVGEPASTLELHVRSLPEMLRRLRAVVEVVAGQAGITGAEEAGIKTAVTEAAANAILHGSPEGPRNHVHVSFHLDDRRLIVDVADQGRGFDPGAPAQDPAAQLREHGFGILMMRRLMDHVEFFHGGRGMLVRMTKHLSPAPPRWAG
jgi:anti-sigma regulatory factor (Ser/Thr protein kinase)